jgi:hypothetical protein
MEYQKALRTRKTGLLQLISENKFEQQKSLGSSVGDAISDKFKALGTGLQEAVDPLNWTRKLFGKGIVGDIAVTGLGRLFGRKDSTIGYFGGFKRKTKKDPNFSTIGPGIVRPLKVGDSTADILGKMYVFMVKTDDKKRAIEEIEKAFQQEQLDEEERRNKELYNSIKKPKASMLTKFGAGSSLLGFLGKLLDSLLSALAGWQTALLAALLAALAGFSSQLRNVPILRFPKRQVNKAIAQKEKDNLEEELKTKEEIKAQEKPGFQKDAIDKIRERDARIKAERNPPSKWSKAREFATGAVKPLASKINVAALKTLTRTLHWLQKIGLNKALVGAGLFADIADLAEDVGDGKVEDMKEIKRRFYGILAKALGGQAGAELGAYLGGVGGSLIMPGWGTLIGGVAGGAVGYMGGEKVAAGLWDFFTTNEEAPVNTEKVDKFISDSGGAVGPNGAAFGVPPKGVKARQIEPKPPASTPVKKDIPEVKKVSASDNSGGSSVAVNNVVKNIGGEKSKVINTSSARSRNIDLERLVLNNSVPI